MEVKCSIKLIVTKENKCKFFIHAEALNLLAHEKLEGNAVFSSLIFNHTVIGSDFNSAFKNAETLIDLMDDFYSIVFLDAVKGVLYENKHDLELYYIERSK